MVKRILSSRSSTASRPPARWPQYRFVRHPESATSRATMFRRRAVQVPLASCCARQKARGNGNTLLGFNSQSGSKADLMRRCCSSSCSANWYGIWYRFSTPTPCSPVKQPPTSTQSFSMSAPNVSALNVKTAGVVGVEHDQRMQIAVAGMEDVGHLQTKSIRHFLNPPQNVRQLAGRDRSVHAQIIRTDAAYRLERACVLSIASDSSADCDTFRLIKLCRLQISDSFASQHESRPCSATLPSTSMISIAQHRADTRHTSKRLARMNRGPVHMNSSATGMIPER